MEQLLQRAEGGGEACGIIVEAKRQADGRCLYEVGTELVGLQDAEGFREGILQGE